MYVTKSCDVNAEVRNFAAKRHHVQLCPCLTLGELDGIWQFTVNSEYVHSDVDFFQCHAQPAKFS
jgi:hypothetical protein